MLTARLLHYQPSRSCVTAAGRPNEPFNENVAQVKRLISRDRKEFLGNEDDILDKYNEEFSVGERTSMPDKGESGCWAHERPTRHLGLGCVGLTGAHAIPALPPTYDVCNVPAIQPSPTPMCLDACA